MSRGSLLVSSFPTLLLTLSSLDSSYQNVHALTLTANSHTFIENASAPRSASYDQSVSFDRVSFTATTTREIGEDDALQQDLELELESVERVLIEQAGGECFELVRRLGGRRELTL